MMRAPGTTGTSLLGSGSTHRDDMIILPDLTATLFSAAGQAAAIPATVVGQPLRVGDPIPREEAVERLRDADTAGQTIRNMGGVFFTTLAVLQVLFYVAAFLLLRRRSALGTVRVAAVALASIPVSTYLINLTPWEASPAPTLTLVGGLVAFDVVLAVLALRAARLTRPENILAPLLVVSGVTAAVLLGDLLSGTHLQLNSVMGYTGVVGARYYGLGNIPFALLATAVLLVATGAADSLVRHGRRSIAVALIAGLGVFAMILGGWPGVGSDFGGVIAFVPGIAVAALIVAGRRVSIWKLGLFCVAGGVIVLSIAYLDYRRPPGSQTHLGRFVGQIFDGTFWPVIARKLDAMLGTLLSPNLMPVVIAGGGVPGVRRVAARPGDGRGAAGGVRAGAHAEGRPARRAGQRRRRHAGQRLGRGRVVDGAGAGRAAGAERRDPGDPARRRVTRRRPSAGRGKADARRLAGGAAASPARRSGRGSAAPSDPCSRPRRSAAAPPSPGRRSATASSTDSSAPASHRAIPAHGAAETVGSRRYQA